MVPRESRCCASKQHKNNDWRLQHLGEEKDKEEKGLVTGQENEPAYSSEIQETQTVSF